MLPLQASHVNAPMTSPTSGYHTDARPLSPADQSSGGVNGSVVIKPNAIRRVLMIFNLSQSELKLNTKYTMYTKENPKEVFLPYNVINL